MNDETPLDLETQHSKQEKGARRFTSAEMSNDPKQPMRLEKKTNIFKLSTSNSDTKMPVRVQRYFILTRGSRLHTRS